MYPLVISHVSYGMRLILLQIGIGIATLHHALGLPHGLALGLGLVHIGIRIGIGLGLDWDWRFRIGTMLASAHWYSPHWFIGTLVHVSHVSHW